MSARRTALRDRLNAAADAMDDRALALSTGALVAAMRQGGLSLGDRACLALDAARMPPR